MKIGFDAKRAFLNSSGLGNYSRNTLTALSGYFPDHNYVLFTPEVKTGLFQNYSQFDVVSPKNPASKLFKSFWRNYIVGSQLHKHNLDLFHGLSNELPHCIRRSKNPKVVTIHDLIFIRFPQFYKYIDRNIYFQKVKHACNVATKIIAISNQTKKDIVTYFDINPEKIEVLYQSVSPVFFEKQTESTLLSKYNLPEKFILCVGTVEQRKNQLSVIKAIRTKNIELPIVFVGNPTEYSNEIVRFVNNHNLNNQVYFLTKIPEADLAGLYQRAFCAVYISLFEGFGLPIIEAMASGCPVITSNVSCLPETAGGAAILCDPYNINDIGEKISSVIENDTFRAEYIQKGIERAGLFHPEKYAQNLISLYSNILS